MICRACIIGRHDHCSAQVTATNAPCSCEYCWRMGKMISSTLKALAKSNEDAKIESLLEDTPE